MLGRTGAFIRKNLRDKDDRLTFVMTNRI